MGIIVGVVALAAAAVVAAPPGAARFDYQLGGAYDPDDRVQVVSRDWRDSAAPGRYSICYVNAFQVQPGERQWWHRRHPSLLLRRHGRLVVDQTWGEVLLDTTSSRKRSRLASVHSRAITSCSAKGYQAVELDNLDSYSRSRGIIRARDNLDLARRLVVLAHAAGLAVAQKNAAELAAAGRDWVGFDFAIAEECEAYGECDRFEAAYGTRMIEVEYSDMGRRWFRRACARRGSRISVLLRDRNIVPRGRRGYVSAWCPGVT